MQKVLFKQNLAVNKTDLTLSKPILKTSHILLNRGLNSMYIKIYIIS